jgi:hypothetical protein
MFDKIFNKKNEFLENTEQATIEKLDSLEINYKHSLDKNGKVIYRFFNVTEENLGVFILDAKDKKVVFHTFHFGEDRFKHPEDKNSDISPDNLIKYVSEKFPDIDNLIVSCCYPDDAKNLFQDTETKPIILGFGLSEYKTIYNDKKHFITISSAE